MSGPAQGKRVRHRRLPHTQQSPILVPKRPYVASACDRCRRDRTRCDGSRPVCDRCFRRKLECTYDARLGESSLQASRRGNDDLVVMSTAQKEILKLLETLPEGDAHSLMRRISTGIHPFVLLQEIKTGDVVSQMALEPETRFRYQLPYSSQMPSEYIANNPYLRSLLYDGASLYNSSQRPKSPSPMNKSNLKDKHLYLMPFHAAEVVDPLITNAKPSRWTQICDDDALAQGLLASFFRCEYSFTMAFQKDLFLEDMAADRDDFCSSLLVNVVLAYASTCYPKFEKRMEYWNTDSYLYKFLAEANRLWEMECDEPRVTTVQAGIIFSVIYNLCGLDPVGVKYRIIAIDHACKMGWFKGPIKAESERERKGLIYTAWAVYSWESLVGFSFMQVPTLRTPPHDALPDPEEDPAWYGEIWVKYPLTDKLSPSNFGHIFKAKCQFRVLMSRFCAQAYYKKDVKVPLAEASQLHWHMRQWYDSLPGPLRPTTIVLPAHLQLHIYYYHLLVTIYGPWADIETDQIPHPKEIVAEACRRIYTLVRVYYLRHGFEYMDLFIVIPLIFAGLNCIKAIKIHHSSPELELLRSTLILVVTGLKQQSQNHFLSEALYLVIRGMMRPQETALLNGVLDLSDEDDKRKALRKAVQSQWPVSVVKREEELESHKLVNLVENLTLGGDAPSPSSNE